MNEDLANELLQQVAHGILDDPGIAGDWDTVSVVARVTEDAISAYGYTYRGATATPVAPEGDELLDLIRAFQEATAGEDGRAWRACLIQIDQRGGEIQMAFEHEDPDRWNVTPDTIDSMPELIRMKPEA